MNAPSLPPKLSRALARAGRRRGENPGSRVEPISLPMIPEDLRAVEELRAVIESRMGVTVPRTDLIRALVRIGLDHYDDDFPSVREVRRDAGAREDV